jgi:hypothetical protein
LISDGNETLKEDITIQCNRAYFKSDKKIFSNGFNFRLITNKLYVLESKETQNKFGNGFISEANILTTLPNTLAQFPVQLEGSKVTIEAEEAHGTLKVAMIGFNGQNGRNGEELDQERGLVRTLDPALNGANGQDSVIFKDTVACPSRRGDGGCQRTVLSCQNPPTNGSNGRQGLAGTPGENGQRGGNTGSFFVDIKRPGDFKVEIGQLAGKPGRGGIGGAGSPGGLAGKAGRQDHPCPAAADGTAGPQGAPGANGANGADAVIGTVNTGNIPAYFFYL